MDERRGDLGRTWRQVAADAGVSVNTLMRNAENPEGIRTTTKKGIERALRWDRGSIDRIAAGLDPVPLAEASPAVAPDGPVLSPETRRRLAAMTWPEIKERLDEEEDLRGEDAAVWLMEQIALAREDAQKGQ